MAYMAPPVSYILMGAILMFVGDTLLVIHAEFKFTGDPGAPRVALQDTRRPKI